MVDGVSAELKELISLRRYALSLSYPPDRKSLNSGNHKSKLRGRGMDFSEVRNYQAGDEIRHMEWRVTARTGKPHIKIYQEEKERPVVILADFNPSMIFGTKKALKSVVAARLASIIAWTAMKQGDKVGGFLFSASQHSEFIPRSRDAGVLPLLASLSDYTDQSRAQTNEQPRKLSDALIRLRRVARPGSILVLISDFYSVDSECEQHLKRLREHNDILAYHVCDPIELTPPIPQYYAITDGHKKDILDLNNKAIRTAYEDYCQKRIHQLQEGFKNLGIQYNQVTSDSHLAYLVKETFPRRTHG